MLKIYKGTQYDDLTISVPEKVTVTDVRLFHPETKEYAPMTNYEGNKWMLAKEQTADLPTGVYSLEIYAGDTMYCSMEKFASVMDSSKFYTEVWQN